MHKRRYYVGDYCHVTGKYKGSAHNACIRSFRLIYKIPAIFHNLKEYDSHLIMQEINLSKESFTHTKHVFSSDVLDSIRKRVFPFDYMDKFKKIQRNKSPLKK